MTKLLNKLNDFFIAGKADIQTSDLAWFYGTMTLFTIMLFVSIALHIK